MYCGPGGSCGSPGRCGPGALSQLEAQCGRSLDRRAHGSPRTSSRARKTVNHHSDVIAVNVDSALDITPCDSFGVHKYSATAYYEGESEAEINARRTPPIRANVSSTDPSKENCILFQRTTVPHDPRRKFLLVSLFEEDSLGDTYMGTTTLPLRDRRLATTAPWPLIQDGLQVGTLTLNMQVPIAEFDAEQEFGEDPRMLCTKPRMSYSRERSLTETSNCSFRDQDRTLASSSSFPLLGSPATHGNGRSLVRAVSPFRTGVSCSNPVPLSFFNPPPAPCLNYFTHTPNSPQSSLDVTMQGPWPSASDDSRVGAQRSRRNVPPQRDVMHIGRDAQRGRNGERHQEQSRRSRREPSAEALLDMYKRMWSPARYSSYGRGCC